MIRLRYRNVVLGGVFAGLAGAYLTLELSGSFQNGMTSGRGFIALAAVIFGRWTPIGAFGAALLFYSFEALRVAISLTPPTGQLGDVLRAIPPQFYGTLPYVVTIVVLAGGGRPEHPPGRGRPAVREGGQDVTGDERAPGMGRPRPPGGPRRRPVLDDAAARASAADDAPDRGRRARRRTRAGRRSASSATWSTQGFECVPVNPNDATVLGVPAFRTWPRRSTRDRPGRPRRRLPALGAVRRPRSRRRSPSGARCLWLQLGVVNWEAARIAHAAGLAVVMDRCTAIELRAARQLTRRRRPASAT